MKKRRFKGFEISRLVVGGVQFGLPYGIANRLGKPPYESVLAIVRRAFAAGVNALDTAALYGESEAVLGRVIHELDLKEKAFVTSKLGSVKGSTDGKPQAVQHFVRESVIGSLTNLGLEQLSLYLLHRVHDLPYLDSVLALKDQGFICHVGVSVYTPAEALRAVSTAGVEAIQCPTSLLDQRFLRENVFVRAREERVAIFARSVYLQGLLAIPEDDIPAQLAAVKPVRRALEETAANLGISLIELALRFVDSLQEARAIVVGMESVEQVESNLRFFDKDPLPQDVMATLRSQVPDLPESILHPGQWSQEAT